MPVTVKQPTDIKVQEYTGLTSGNGVIIGIPSNANAVSCEYIPTAAGTATVKYSLNPNAPTDFTNFSSSAKGAQTATGGEQGYDSVRWIGLDPASGTWTFRVSYKQNGFGA